MQSKQLGMCMAGYQIQKFKKEMCDFCSSREWSGIAWIAWHDGTKHY